MKKLNTIVRGTASIFNSTSAVNVDNIFKKYPTAHEKTVKEALQHSWDTVGIAIKGSDSAIALASFIFLHSNITIPPS